MSSKIGHIWRRDLNSKEINEALDALEEMRGVVNGTSIACTLVLEGKEKLNIQGIRDSFREHNIRLSNLIEKLSAGYGEKS